MTWRGEPDVFTLLDRERGLLDRIFGAGAYRIESTNMNEAVVRSSKLSLEVGFESRDGSIASTLTVTEPWGEELDYPQGWARFLGRELPPLPRNRTGRVTMSREEQIRAELNVLAWLSAEIFSDPQKTRDAAHFVKGYRIAYTDWASGAWNPD